MAFNLFNKKKNSDNDLPEAPDFDIPEPPKIDNKDTRLPEVPSMDEQFPEPPKLDEDLPDFDMPKEEIEEKPMPVPKPDIKDELPDFPNSEIVKDKEVPEPPAFLSKMDDVKQDMSDGYVEHGTNIVKLNKPIFVEVSDYKKVLRTVKSIERDAKKSKNLAIELEEIKNKREKHLEGWDKKLENMQRSLIFADKILFEEGGLNV